MLINCLAHRIPCTSLITDKSEREDPTIREGSILKKIFEKVFLLQLISDGEVTPTSSRPSLTSLNWEDNWEQQCIFYFLCYFVLTQIFFYGATELVRREDINEAKSRSTEQSQKTTQPVEICKLFEQLGPGSARSDFLRNRNDFGSLRSFGVGDFVQKFGLVSGSRCEPISFDSGHVTDVFGTNKSHWKF